MSFDDRLGPPKLIPGRSAYSYWDEGQKEFVVLVAACFLLVALAAAASGTPFVPIVVVLFVVVVGTLAARGFRTQWRLHLAMVAEHDAGYTTIPRRRKDIWVLDHQSGEVLSRPSHPETLRPPADRSHPDEPPALEDLPLVEKNSALIQRLDDLYASGGISKAEYLGARVVLTERNKASE